MEVKITAKKEKQGFVKCEVNAVPKAMPVERLFPLFELMLKELQSEQAQNHQMRSVG
jgi:hypothetical protein